MGKKMLPLTFGMIEEGELAVALDEQLQKLHRRMCEYAREHGEAAKGSKGKLTLSIEVKCEDPTDGFFGVTADLKAQAPSRPSRTTMAMQADDASGEPCLFAQASGSTEDDPRQLKLATKRGDVVVDKG